MPGPVWDEWMVSSILSVPWACAPSNCFFSTTEFLGKRYLDDHVNPKMAQCSQWYARSLSGSNEMLTIFP